MDVKTLCLGALSRAPHTGYEIRKQFEDGPFAHFQDAGFGSIYPALRRLTEEGLVECEEQPQDSRPDKKVYRLTPAGRGALFDAINSPPGPDKLRSDFSFVLFFSDLLSPRQIDELMSARIAHHAAVLEKLETCDLSARPAGEAFVTRYGIAMHRAAKAFFETHRHELVGDLINRKVAE
jgi:DNA-binding PadR family transcriptional regulator